jgi:uncharacterized protein YqgV (UPF0045/DUF77 family)
LFSDLDEKILHSISKALEKIGTGVGVVTFFQFKVETGLESNAIPRNMELFKTALSMFFGVGYKFVVATIRIELRKDFGLSNQTQEDLTEIVALIRKNALKKSLTF